VLEGLDRRLLLPSFPEDELVTLDTRIRDVVRGTMSVVVFHQDEAAAIAVGEGDADFADRAPLLPRATDPGHRGRGLGNALLTAALTIWKARWHPGIVIAEIAPAGTRDDDPAHGDAARRQRFYGRLGAVALDLPYFQPALGASRDRADPMCLIALAIDRAWLSPDGTRLTRTRELAAYLADYTDDGTPAPDPRRAQLLDAVSSPECIRILPLPR
jgi:GNAT superfamily N-acetyltransferase